MSGLDISYDTSKRRAAADPNYRGLPITDRLVEMGRMGQKTGKGWYRYEKGDRTPIVDPEVHGVIKEVASEIGIEQRTFTDEEILRRLLFSSVNEACKILEEGKALRASDIDVMWLNGFGFPRYRGGLMFWADGIGAREVYNQIAAWHQRYGARWTTIKAAAGAGRERRPAARGQVEGDEVRLARAANGGLAGVGRAPSFSSRSIVALAARVVALPPIGAAGCMSRPAPQPTAAIRVRVGVGISADNREAAPIMMADVGLAYCELAASREMPGA